MMFGLDFQGDSRGRSYNTYVSLAASLDHIEGYTSGCLRAGSVIST